MKTLTQIINGHPKAKELWWEYVHKPGGPAYKSVNDLKTFLGWFLRFFDEQGIIISNEYQWMAKEFTGNIWTTQRIYLNWQDSRESAQLAAIEAAFRILEERL